MLKALITIFLLSFAVAAFAQKTDTVRHDTSVIKNVRDTLPATAPAPVVRKPKKEPIYHPDSTHSAGLAFRRSLMVPAWGQVYNKSYWKVPLVYGGLGALGYYVFWNQKYYKEFLSLAKIVKTGEIPTQGSRYYKEYLKYKTDYELYSGLGYETLANESDYYLRNKTLCIIGFIGVWGIQAVEAYVQGKFIQSYTIDDDLSFRVEPAIMGQPMYAFNTNFVNAVIPGIKVTFTL